MKVYYYISNANVYVFMAVLPYPTIGAFRRSKLGSSALVTCIIIVWILVYALSVECELSPMSWKGRNFCH